MKLSRLLFCLAFVHAAACADASPAEPTIASELGLDMYLGRSHPKVEEEDGDETVYTFDTSRGPMCLEGDPYRVSVRDTGSENLVIFLQGGGACWSDFCLVVTKAPKGVPDVDVLNPELDVNPVADWNVVYLPYCDGSFFAGDAEHDDDGDGEIDRYQHGLQNLSAALDVARKRFPHPARVLLAGSSGGAYGTLLGTALVRHVYPDTRLQVFADSGIGLAHNGDPAFLQKIFDEFNLSRFVPPDCPECLADGHATGLVAWYLARDPEVEIGLFSAWYDSVLGNTFLQEPPEDYRDALMSQTDPIQAAYPDRFRRFIIDGTMHTTLLGDPSGIIGTDLNAVIIPRGVSFTGLLLGHIATTSIGSVMFSDWFQAMIDGDHAVWVDVSEPPGEPTYEPPAP
jgi:hypothetical protein